MIFWAIPFGYLPKNKKINILEKAVFNPGYKSMRKFVKESKNHLNENGRILIGFSRDIGDFRLLEKICKVNGFLIELVSKTKISEGKNKVGMEIYELMAKY